MSRLYAQQCEKTHFFITPSDVKLCFAIIVLSGFVPLPRRRLLWDSRPDTRNEAVASSITLNRFEELLRYLHFADNTKLNPDDKMAKLRPLLSMLNERFLQFWPVQQNIGISVDERMAPHYGRHSAKQFIRGKPIRFGYKLWCLNTPSGYLIQKQEVVKGIFLDLTSKEHSEDAKCVVGKPPKCAPNVQNVRCMKLALKLFTENKVLDDS